MEQTPTTQPLPEPAPVSLQEAWLRARMDYETGVTGPVAAERHGLNPRTLRRRAAAEGWRKPPPPDLTELLARQSADYGRLTCAPEASEADLVDQTDALAPFVLANSLEIGAMLMAPRPEGLARFAFRRAVEAAGAGAPRETAQWLRVVEQLRRVEGLLDPLTAPVRPADCARAALAEQMNDLAGLWSEHKAEEGDRE